MTNARRLLLVVLVSMLGACAGGGPTKSDDPKKIRRDLAEGYSLLYSDLRGLDRAELVLYVKEESDAVDELVSEVSDFAGKVRQDLERLSKAYPAARIDLDPMPEMEKRKRASMLKDRVKEYAPVTGKVGKRFERSLLGQMRSGLNQQAHLCKVMAEVEPEKGLREFLLDTQKGMERHHERVNRFVEKRYGY
jgi:hypothetical protein